MNFRNFFVSACWVAVLCCRAAEAQPVSDTAFTYQGELEQNGMAVSQQCDFEFSLWTGNNAPDPGVQVGPEVEASVQVDEGIFAAELDFGADPLDGSARWLNIAVCCATPCAPGYTELAPRQIISSSPFSVQTRGIFVDESMNVGIGTTSPNSLLSVGQGDEAELQVGASPQLSLSKDLSNNKFRMQITGSGHFGRLLQIGRDDMNHDIVMSGDVGIGTEAPTALLTVGAGDEAELQVGQMPQLSLSKDIPNNRFMMQLTGTGYGGYDMQLGRDDEGHDIFMSGDVDVSGGLDVDGPATIFGSLGVGFFPSVESKFHVLADNNDFGVLTQALAENGSSIGLHVNSGGFSSLAKNAYYTDSWQRFDGTKGAFLLEVDPDGDTSLSAAPPGGGTINWNRAMVIKANGRIGMGTNSPDVKLHVTGNQLIDGALTVFGTVVATGTVSIGYEIVTNFCDDNNDCTVACPGGKKAIGGGCTALFDEIRSSIPVNNGGSWYCDTDTFDLDDDGVTAYAICANVN